MGSRKFFMVPVLLFFMVIGCKSNDKELLIGDWKVTHIVYEGATIYPSPNSRDVTIDFSEKGRSALMLHVNERAFKYEPGSKNDIKIDFGDITFVCCDDNFSEKVDFLLSETINYEFTGEKSLMLLGEGQISLERQNDK